MSPVKKNRSRVRAASGSSNTAAVRGMSSAPTQASDGVTSYTWVWYLLSVFVPFAGILIALFLYDQENWNVRKIGRNCLLLSFVFWILLPIFFLMLALLITAITVASSVSDAVAPAD